MVEEKTLDERKMNILKKIQESFFSHDQDVADEPINLRTNTGVNIKKLENSSNKVIRSLIPTYNADSYSSHTGNKASFCNRSTNRTPPTHKNKKSKIFEDNSPTTLKLQQVSIDRTSSRRRKSYIFDRTTEKKSRFKDS